MGTLVFQDEEMGPEELQEFLQAVKRHNQQMIGAPRADGEAELSVPAVMASAAGGAAVPLMVQACSRSPSLLRMDIRTPTEDSLSQQSVPSRELENPERPPTPDTRPTTPVVDEAWSEANGGSSLRGLGAMVYPDEDNLSPSELPSSYGQALEYESIPSLYEDLPHLSEEDVRHVFEAVGPLPSDSDGDLNVSLGDFENPIGADLLREGDELVGREAIENVRASGRELAEHLMIRAMINDIDAESLEDGRRGRGRGRGGEVRGRGRNASTRSRGSRGRGEGSRGRGEGVRGRGEGRGRGNGRVRGSAQGSNGARGRGRARGRGAGVGEASTSAASEANAALFGGHNLRSTAGRRQATGKGGKK